MLADLVHLAADGIFRGDTRLGQDRLAQGFLGPDRFDLNRDRLKLDPGIHTRRGFAKTGRAVEHRHAGQAM